VLEDFGEGVYFTIGKWFNQLLDLGRHFFHHLHSDLPIQSLEAELPTQPLATSEESFVQTDNSVNIVSIPSEDLISFNGTPGYGQDDQGNRI